MNVTTQIGNLTKQPEMRYSQEGKPIASLTIAVNDGWGDKKEVSFFDVTVFGKVAEVLSMKDKGEKIGVTGRLKQDRWEAQDGTKRSKVKIIASSVDFLTPKQAEISHNEAQQPQAGDMPIGDDFVIPGEEELF